ncbi:MAG TPA: methyltransferase domain-containing protein, partial [Sneathiellales bacterium]|nr:methyltransferase domain-containing protein [Sneathiellales bacterium]
VAEYEKHFNCPVHFDAKEQSLVFAADILATPKYVQPQLAVSFLLRYEAILARSSGWKPLEFLGKSVIEIGAGPMLGWGPLSVFRGADPHVCFEPRFNPQIFEEPQLIDRYFRPQYKDLCAIFGTIHSFEEFMALLSDRVRIERSPFQTGMYQHEFDIALSNSCLEHVDDLEEMLKGLARALKPDAKFLHLVDFGSHRAETNPFHGMYGQTTTEYFAKFGHKINLKRAPEMLNYFAGAGFDVDLVPYYSSPEGFNETIIPFWSDRFDDETLFLKTALFASRNK